jgi:hypothetical protein
VDWFERLTGFKEEGYSHCKVATYTSSGIVEMMH